MGANDVLNEDNYFVWEFNARMKLAKKGLLEHIDATKAPRGDDVGVSLWKVNERYESLRKRVYDDQPKSPVHGSRCRDNCRSVEDFEELLSSQKHP